MENLGIIAIIVGVIGVIIAKVLGRSKTNPKIAELAVKAEAAKTEIAKVEAERETLKVKVQTEQGRLTEQEKSDFWKKELEGK